MRFVSLLLLVVLLSVFVGLAAPFASASDDDCGRCCAGETSQEKDGADSASPCNTAECPCGFCLPAILPEALDVPLSDAPVPSSPSFRPPLRLSPFPDGIDYPPEPLFV